MRSFHLKNLKNLMLHKCVTPPALELINTPILHPSRRNERKHQESHQAKKKNKPNKNNNGKNRQNRLKGMQFSLLQTWTRGDRRKLGACLWLQYRFYTAPRKRKWCPKLQRRLGDLSAAGVILALWPLWLFRYRGHGEAELRQLRQLTCSSQSQRHVTKLLQPPDGSSPLWSQ